MSRQLEHARVHPGAVTASLSSAIFPLAWDNPQSYTIPVTEPIPAGAYIRVGDEQRGENLDVFECTGTGPYLLRLARNFTGTYMAGTPVTVLKVAEAPP